MGLTLVYDATHENISHLPSNASYAGYATGGPTVAWTDNDWRQHPDGIRIDQTPASGQWDRLADGDDYERGAVTLNELAPRAKERLAAFHAGERPGQRSPFVYFSASDIHNVVNALVKGGVTSGIGLWLANWSLTNAQAVTDVLTASGPFPIIAVQYHNAGLYDVSVFSTTWLTTRSVGPTPNQPKPEVPPGQWLDPKAWSWKTVSESGTGLDGKHHEWDFNPSTGKWTRVSLPNRYHIYRGPPYCLRGGPLGRIGTSSESQSGGTKCQR